MAYVYLCMHGRPEGSAITEHLDFRHAYFTEFARRACVL